ncbi:2OG-Fe(II) oxygenase [Nitrosopumilus sp.]|nr:2OG-Fe(II) oxygenase [Nitrosopumilus sp.]
MWDSIVITNSEISNRDIKKIISGEKSAIIIKNFYEKRSCKKIIKKINNTNIENDSKKFNHIGPFLMNYTTTKEKYFQNAKKANIIFKNIFLNIDDPINKIKLIISKVYPNHEISETKENRMSYASCTIRRHEKGKKVPLHKDNVTYEGVEYNVSKIDNQLSCILHLQETEKGGKLLIYKKKWEKKLEKFREIEFGYNSILTKNIEVDVVESKIGDLVIINPNYLHEITKIQGNVDRITLGMFFGIQNKSKKIFSWA